MLSDIFVFSIVAGLATCLGAVLVILLGKPGERTLSVLFGMAAGIMLAVVLLDLIPTAMEFGTLRQTLTGFCLGVILMLILEVVLSQFFRVNTNVTNSSARWLKMGYLIAIGIALHDLPEGFAIAAGYSAKQHLGLIIALAIGLHNIPEGMATTTPLRMGGVSVPRIIATNTAVSLFTPLGTFIGLLLVDLSAAFIAVLLAAAAGAMTFIVYNELLPESRRRHPNYSTVGGVFGFFLILLLGLL